MPFHAWCVVKGVDVEQEVNLATGVLRSGARSLFIDLESYPGFWAGTRTAAQQYVDGIRRVHPAATIIVTVDARPWEIDRIPLQEFASAANALAPQVYWSDFATQPNVEKYRAAGADPGANGITPTFALDIAARKLAQFRLPLHPIGPGLVEDRTAWGQFITESFARDVETLSVWRMGTTKPMVLDALQSNPPRARLYVVQPGDTLYGLAGDWRTSVDEIMRANQITDANLVVVAQVLAVPKGATVPAARGGAVTPIATAARPAGTGSGNTYVVQIGRAHV